MKVRTSIGWNFSRHAVLSLTLLVITISCLVGYLVAYRSVASPETPSEDLNLFRELFVVFVGTFALLVAAYRMDWTRHSDSRNSRERSWNALEQAFTPWYKVVVKGSVTCRSISDNIYEFLIADVPNHTSFKKAAFNKVAFVSKSLLDHSELFAELVYHLRPISSELEDKLAQCSESYITLVSHIFEPMAFSNEMTMEQAKSLYDNIVAESNKFEQLLIDYRESQSELRTKQIML